ncbi:MAG: hypothetical protein M3P44_12810 [Actinomycetota bacterium]|nr:hypothetical protein [Actinomycetota bacterium]
MPRVLTALVVALLAVPAAASAAQLDATVAALRSSPVYVAPGAKPTLTAAEQQQVRAAIDRAGTPVYVAVLPAGALDETGGDADEFVRRLGKAESEPGTYAVVAGGKFRAASTRLKRGRAGDLATEAFDARSKDGLAPTLVHFVDLVGKAVRSSGSGGGSSRGSGGGGLAILALLAGGGGLFALTRARRRRREQAAQVEELRRIANDDIVALGDDVRAIDLDIEMPGADPKAREDLGVALDRYDRAELALKGARTPQDFAPVSTALEEGRWAMESAKARLAGRTPPERRPPCFFDPRHGPSTRDVEWSPDGYPAREVPACEADAVRIESGEEPMTREVELGGRRMPYYAGPGWMGPYSGGYYGGFGGFGAGLFGGMILGDLMGDGFGGGYADYGGDGGGDFGGGGFGGGDWGGGDFGGGGGGDFGGGGGDF